MASKAEEEAASAYNIDVSRVNDQCADDSDTGSATRPPRGTAANAKEHDIQCVLVEWAWAHDDARIRALRSFPNDGPTSYAKGRVAGTPDLLLPVSSGSFGALWVELKRPGGDLSASQYEQLQLLQRMGHAVDVAWTTQQAAFAIENYLYDPSSFLSGY